MDGVIHTMAMDGVIHTTVMAGAIHTTLITVMAGGTLITEITLTTPAQEDQIMHTELTEDILPALIIDIPNTTLTAVPAITEEVRLTVQQQKVHHLPEEIILKTTQAVHQEPETATAQKLTDLQTITVPEAKTTVQAHHDLTVIQGQAVTAADQEEVLTEEALMAEVHTAVAEEDHQAEEEEDNFFN